MLTTLILLLGAHFLCDYPLQGDFLSKAKNRLNPIPTVPWYQAMFAHAFIHAAAVYVITGSLPFFLVELIVHGITDDYKCRGHINFNTDQAIHLLCKVGYVILLGMYA